MIAAMAAAWLAAYGTVPGTCIARHPWIAHTAYVAPIHPARPSCGQFLAIGTMLHPRHFNRT